ncbi:glycosyltransferase family protein [Desulfosediminicola flagellatus]|uniref:glycosyltransferase family protein n=1 Tax=Desulfosediminicola flagellatus TaxID=2569541 RepID=UPI0010AC0806|nr:glycosyltransferase [Desulfosediminicola flagellatus]
MKIAYYCQHVLGIGHYHRSVEICKALAENHEVSLIVGGPEVDPAPEPIQTYKLPGLQMDSNFLNLAPCDAGATLEDVKERRTAMLMDFFREQRPDAFVVELYPFGRKAFRFELDPVLKAIRNHTLPHCKCYVSLRDILVERPNDRDKFENRVITILNSLFDGLLIHSDENIITLDETFHRYDDIAIPLAYTGFVTPLVTSDSRDSLRQTLNLEYEDKLVVVSIGGGNVGTELLRASIDAFRLLSERTDLHMQLFTGPYFPDDEFLHLQEILPSRVTLNRFANNFSEWLQAADLSISMAGYNTCMNIVQAGVPSLVYPFAQNREQAFRASKLQKKANIRILTFDDLIPTKLAAEIIAFSDMPRLSVAVNISGATQSRIQIEAWHNSN